MKQGMLIRTLVIIAVMLIANQVCAAPLKDIMSQRYAKEKDIAPVVKSCIDDGMDTREVVKTAIAMVQDACYVIKCSLGAGGGLEATLLGAIDAGATSDVCARCATDGGANPQAVAKILEKQGLAYTTTDSPPSPIAFTPPGGNRGGKSISPSTFR